MHTRTPMTDHKGSLLQEHEQTECVMPCSHLQEHTSTYTCGLASHPSTVQCHWEQGLSDQHAATAWHRTSAAHRVRAGASLRHLPLWCVSPLPATQHQPPEHTAAGTSTVHHHCRIALQQPVTTRDFQHSTAACKSHALHT